MTSILAQITRLKPFKVVPLVLLILTRADSLQSGSDLTRQQRIALSKGMQEEAGGKLDNAEVEYRQARALARQLPPETYHIETEALWYLGHLYSKQKRADLAEKTYLERKDILLSRQKGIDLDLGIALFDLQSLYEGTHQDQKAKMFMQQATDFYNHCKSSTKLAQVCDRRLADVQGLYGDYLFNQHRLKEAEPYLRAVAARRDTEVRAEILESSLMALGAIVSLRDINEAKRLGDRALQLRYKYPEARRVPWPSHSSSVLQKGN